MAYTLQGNAHKEWKTLQKRYLFIAGILQRLLYSLNDMIPHDSCKLRPVSDLETVNRSFEASLVQSAPQQMPPVRYQSMLTFPVIMLESLLTTDNSSKSASND